MHSYSSVLHSVRQKMAHLSPSRLVDRNKVRRDIRKFADAVGLVYFGFVDQKDDEHHLIRGITASNTHKDSHYCLGTYATYDIGLVLRRDSLRYNDKRMKNHAWTIITVDLHTAYDVPHMFISHTKKRELLLAKFSQLTPLIVGRYTPHDSTFTEQYSISASVSRAIEVEQFANAQITAAIPTVFGDIAVEVHENTVYLYASTDLPTRATLEKMLSAGVWLAEHFDYTARQLQVRE